jgi:hypothetical protein
MWWKNTKMMIILVSVIVLIIVVIGVSLYLKFGSGKSDNNTTQALATTTQKTILDAITN